MSCEMGLSPNPKTTAKVALLGLHHIFADGLKQDSSTYYSTNCSWGCSRTIPVPLPVTTLAVLLLERTG